jgi:hypothetical protein
MSDTRCVVCGEPWDSYGITHGDMFPWEAKLFKAGAGCPSCQGIPNGWEPKTLSDVENGDEDPMLRIIAAEAVENGTAPKWERPEDPVHWECDGCGVQVITNLDTFDFDKDEAIEYRCPPLFKGNRYKVEHYGCPEKEPAHVFENGNRICEFCLEHCDECGTALCSTIDSDTYDEGYSLPSPEGDYYGKNSVCVDCLNTVEEREADRVWQDCYTDSGRIAYIRKHKDQFNFRSFADMLGCARGKYFGGYASEILG